MKLIERYRSAHMNSGHYAVRNNNWDINEIEDNQSVLSLIMYKDDYDNSVNINKWNTIAIRIGGDQFNYNEGQWEFLSLLKIGVLHTLSTWNGVQLVLKVSESQEGKNKFLKEMI